MTDLLLVAVHRSTVEMPVAYRCRPQHSLGNLLAREPVGAEGAQPENWNLRSGVERSLRNRPGINRVRGDRQRSRLRRCDHVMTLTGPHLAATPTCRGDEPTCRS